MGKGVIYLDHKFNSRARLRDVVPGLHLGFWPTGPLNGLTDVPGVLVHTEEIHGRDGAVNTGVTTILPRKNRYESGCFAGLFRFNGAGELTGGHFVQEHGKVASPIVLTNTLSVGDAAYRGILDYAVKHHGGDPADGVGIEFFSAPVVGETFDGYLNDAAAFAVMPVHVARGIERASADSVPEDNRGGGTGTVCFGFKGGTGTSSRVVEGAPGEDGKAISYTVGVLVQANFGSMRDLRVAGVAVGRGFAIDRQPRRPRPRRGKDRPGQKQQATTEGEGSAATAADMEQERSAPEPPTDGSIIVVLATDAPLQPLQCERLAKRATVGLARTGGIGHNSSGDIFLAFSTAVDVPVQRFANKLPPDAPLTFPVGGGLINDETINGLFEAAADATEEAIYNALCMAETMTGFRGRKVEALPLDELRAIMDQSEVNDMVY